MGNIFKYIVLPFILFILFVLSIIFLPKLIWKRYINILWIFIGCFFFFIFEIIMVLVIGRVTGDIKEGFFSSMTESKVPYADRTEIREYIIQSFRDDPTNPVNLELDTTILQEGILSVGKENQKTEIYIGKFIDTSVLNRDIYYVSSRVEEPNKMKVRTSKIQPTPEEEDRLLMQLANQLAKSPEKLKETELRVVTDAFGEQSTIKTVREPYGMAKTEDVEEVEEM